jgi:hypothetical protein
MRKLTFIFVVGFAWTLFGSDGRAQAYPPRPGDTDSYGGLTDYGAYDSSYGAYDSYYGDYDSDYNPPIGVAPPPYYYVPSYYPTTRYSYRPYPGPMYNIYAPPYRGYYTPSPCSRRRY